MKLCNSIDSIQSFESVSKCKNAMILMMMTIGANLQLSFYHSVIGIPILQDDLRYVAMVGSGMELV